MSEQDSRLLTAESLEEIKSMHRPIDRVNLETGQVGRPYCTVCWLPAPCDIALLLDHIAAQAEQLDRQAVVMAWLHSLGGRGYSDEACEELDGDLGVSWRRRDDPNRERVLDEIEAIRRHGVEVARRNDANRP